MHRILIIIFIPFILNSQNEKEIFTMFYNVENFFDTINNPMTSDNEFLPNSKKRWNTDKYNQKIEQLTKVFSSINDGEKPNIIGLCEVENKNVIKDLLDNPFFNAHSYTIIHNNSPDKRGIDCALLFDNNFTLLKKDFIRIDIPNARPTRDIVYVKLKLDNEILNIFVNHWPSRWGGQKETNHRRVITSKMLQQYINNHININEHIIIMGDLNDYATNESVKNIVAKNKFINLTEEIKGEDVGSYNYKDEWNFIDHIIISNSLINKNPNFNTFKEEWMLYTNKNGIKYPSRTYSRNQWHGGFSDHLPIYCSFKL